MRVCGIDPGRSGGLAEITARPDGRAPRVTRVLRLPWVDIGDARPTLDVPTLVEFLLAGGVPDLVVIEKMQYRPRFRGAGPAAGSGGDPGAQVGAGSAYGEVLLAEGYGELVGVAKTLRVLKGLAYRRVAPQTWVPRLIGPVAHPAGATHADRQKRAKAAVVAWCQAHHPDAALVPKGCRVPQDGLADAVALAHYGFARELGVALRTPPDGGRP